MGCSSVHGNRRLLQQQQSPPDLNPELRRPGSDLPYLMPDTDSSSSSKTQNEQRRPSSSGTTTIMSPLNIRVVIVTSALLVVLLAVLALNCAIRCCVRRLFAARLLGRSSGGPSDHHRPSNTNTSTLHKHQLASLPIIIFRINGVDHSPPTPTTRIDLDHPNNKGLFSFHGNNSKSDEDDQQQLRKSGDHHHSLNQKNFSSAEEDEDQMSALPNTDPEIRSSTCCAICLGEFTAGEALRQLACRHLFHVSCVDPWLSRHSASCPICRASPVLPPSPPPPPRNHTQPLPKSIPVPVPSPPLHSLPLPAASSSSSSSSSSESTILPLPAASPVSCPQPSIDLPSNSSSACAEAANHPFSASPAPAPLPPVARNDPSTIPSSQSSLPPPQTPINSSPVPLPQHTTAHQLLLTLQLHIFMLCNSMPPS